MTGDPVKRHKKLIEVAIQHERVQPRPAPVRLG